MATMTPMRPLSPFNMSIPGGLPSAQHHFSTAPAPAPFQFHEFENNAPSLDMFRSRLDQESNYSEAAVMDMPSPPTTEPRPVFGLEPTIINLPSVPRIDPSSSMIPVTIRTPPQKNQVLAEEVMTQTQPSLISQFTRPSVRAAALPPSLVASFVEDNNIPDGHVFPPGAEFIKSWKMKNDGGSEWPAETVLAFVGGSRLQSFQGAPSTYEVGRVTAGEVVDVWAGDLKAPEEAGTYNSFWRLMDKNTGIFFGHRLWISIEVAQPVTKSTSEGDEASNPSLSSSTLAMPGAFFNEEQQDAHSVAAAPRAQTLEYQPTGTGTVSSVSEDLSLLNVGSEDGSVIEVDPVVPGAIPVLSSSVATVHAPVTAASPRPLSPVRSASDSDSEDEFVVVYDSASEDRS
jgi:next-to-BRCA1 protein 1